MKKTEMLMTTNYSIFKLKEENRDIKDVRVRNIHNSIGKIDMTDCKPIIVNEHMEIIDGQTRFEACRGLNLPIYYIKKNLNGKSDEAMILLNVNQSNWTIDEYIEHYIKSGKQVYKDVQACVEKYEVSSSVAVSFVSNSSHGESKSIKNGKLKRGAIPYDTYGDILIDFKEIFKNYNHIFFIRALIYVINFKYYNHKEDYKRFIKHRHDLIGCANTIQYLKMFEEILNYHRRGKKLNIMAEYPRIK